MITVYNELKLTFWVTYLKEAKRTSGGILVHFTHP